MINFPACEDIFALEKIIVTLVPHTRRGENILIILDDCTAIVSQLSYSNTYACCYQTDKPNLAQLNECFS